MAIPTPRTWVANVTAFAAGIMNSDFVASINFLMGRGAGCKDYARLTLTAGVPSLTSGTPLTVQFNGEDWDLRGGHSTSSNQSRYVCQETGKFRVLGQAGFATNANGDRIAFVSVNGSIVASTQLRACAAIPTYVPFAFDIACNAGDYIELGVEQTAGAAVVMTTTNGGCFMCVEWIAV